MRRYEAILAEVQSLMKDGAPVPHHKLGVAEVRQFTPQEIKAVRTSAHMTQWMFAKVIGVTAKSVEGWEGGRAKPDGAARRLIGLIKDNPAFATDTGILIDEHTTKPVGL